MADFAKSAVTNEMDSGFAGWPTMPAFQGEPLVTRLPQGLFVRQADDLRGNLRLQVGLVLEEGKERLMSTVEYKESQLSSFSIVLESYSLLMIN